MANDEARIKQKIELDGEKEYSAAIKNANRNLKTLRSELKAETAELGKNATEQQKNEVKAKSLRKQIAEQEKVVEACRDALEEVREKYADNEEAIAKYEQKLNSARATLGNMRQDLESVGDEAGQSNVEIKAFADSVKSISNAASAVSDTIGGLFTDMVSTVKDAIDLVWGDLTELAARSNSWIDLAGFWNTSAEEIQKWAHAVEHASGSLEDINQIVTKINAADPKKVAELVGVSDENFEDDWKYAMAVMDALSQMDHEARNNAAFEIFGGRQATKAMDLLNDWQKVLDHLDRYDVSKGGVGMTEEEMQTMADIADTINGINSTWSAFKDSFLSGVTGKLTLDLASNTQAILDALISFMDADTEQEREEALDSLKESIEAFFTRIGEAIGAAAEALKEVGTEMQESENGWVSTIGDILVGLSEALEWFTVDENIEKVKAGFLALAAVWTGAKITSAIGNLASLAANIALVKNAGGLFGIFGGAKAATTAATAASGAGGGALATLGAFAAKVVAPLAAFAGTLGWNAFTEQGNDDLIDENGNLTEIAKDAGITMDADGDLHLPENSVTGWDMSGNTIAQTEEGAQGITEEQRAAAEAFWDAYRQDPMNEDIWGESYEEFEQAFAGMEDVFDELDRRLNDLQMEYEDDSWQGLEDIPASIFNGYDLSGAGESIDNAASTMRGLPGQIQSAVRGGMSGIRVQMDGETVGALVAPYVSLEIARGIG